MEAPVRHATPADLPRINEIYNSYIVDRYTSFDMVPWSLADRMAWFEKYARSGRHQVLVIETGDGVVGFAASSPFRDKRAYETSVETTVVLAETVLGRGLGGTLLDALLTRLAAEDIHRVYALIALPNPASVALHARFGFRDVGTLDEVGRKLGSYHSVLIMELGL